MRFLSDILSKYIANNYSFQNEKEKYLVYKKLGIDRILLQDFDGNELYVMQTKLEMLYQDKLNLKLSQELRNLAHIFNKELIPWVHLKGTTLSEELYSDPSIRKVNDIDILVLSKDLQKVIIIAKKMGYEINDPAQLYSEFISNNLFTNHLPPLRKYFVTEGITVVIEVHIEILPFIFLDVANKEELTQTLLRDRVIVKSNEFNIYILDIHNNLIFLILHFMKHYIHHTCLSFQSGKFENLDSINLIHDIAIYMHKYKNLINWCIIIKLIKNMNVVCEVYFILRLINEIYKIIDSEILTKVKLEIRYKNSFSGRFSEYLCKIKVKEMLTGNVTMIIFNFIKSTHTKKYLCELLKPKGQKNPNNYLFEIKADDIQSNNCYLVKNELNIAEYLSSKTYFNWDEIYINIDTIYSVNKRYEDETGIYYFMYLYMFYWKSAEDKLLIKYLKFLPNKNNQIRDMTVYEINDGEQILWKDEEYKIQSNFFYDGYHFTISIPWKKLSIVPYQDMNLKFDFCIVAANESCSTKLSLSNPSDLWYDVSSYSDLTLS